MPETDAEGTFEGVFVAHWEVPRFVVVRGRKLFGLLQRTERWSVHFSPGCEPRSLPPSDGDEDRQRPGRFYRMRVRGRLGPRGRFGHLGFCARELFVSEVLECAETERPGRTW